MRQVRVRPLGMLQQYPAAGERGVLEIDAEPTDTVNDLMARVGTQFNQYLLPALWDPTAGRFHPAVHVFLDGVHVMDRQQTLGDTREAILLLEIAGGADGGDIVS